MNLSELNDGLPETKGWLAPVFGVMSAGSVVIGESGVNYSLPTARGVSGDIMVTNSAGVSSFESLAVLARPFVATGTSTVSNTVAVSNFVPAGLGSLTFSDLAIGDEFWLHMDGAISCLAASTITFVLSMNGSIMLTQVLNAHPAATNLGFSQEWHVVVPDLAGNVRTSSIWYSKTDAATNFIAIDRNTKTISIGVPQTLSVSVQFGAANPGNSITCNNFTLRRN